MNNNDYKWKVAPAPTGRYRSFENRSWPSAEKKDTGELVAYITCTDEYIPANIHTGNHAPLVLHIRYGNAAEDRERLGWFSWKSVQVKYATLVEAKKAFDIFVINHPDHNWGLH